MKISKYCNLRCAYCYEFPDLGNKKRLSLDAIGRIFRNIAGEAADRYESLEFIWHGGEPFLIPLEYYEAIGQLQREIFGEKIPVSNAVQTNLMILTNRHVEFLKSLQFFSSIGVSFDVYGDQRVDVRGRASTRTVLGNMQRLIDNDIPFGAIVVLARNTLPYVREIFRFFSELKIQTRFLAFENTSVDDQIATRQITEHALTYNELVGAYKAIFDEWIASPRAITVKPIDEYIDFAVAFMCGERLRFPTRNDCESVFIVNVDGRVWGASEDYYTDICYGNLIIDNFGQILTSPGRQFALGQTQRRVEQYCAICPYHGFCPGRFVEFATLVQQRLLEEAGCPVKEMISYIVDKFRKSGVDKAILATEGAPWPDGSEPPPAPVSGVLPPWLHSETEFFLAHTLPVTVPHVPEIQLRLAAEEAPLWNLTVRNPRPPYWAYAWAGGQAVARYVLDHPHLVAGRRVLDLGSGSGIIAIAAAKAGAERVIACDTVLLAGVAIAMNAHANGVAVVASGIDVLRENSEFDLSDIDVVLAGDILYGGLETRVIAFFRRCRSAGALVLLGDPGRSSLPKRLFNKRCEYMIPVATANQYVDSATCAARPSDGEPAWAGVWELETPSRIKTA